jgi:hypothetical protein
MTMAVYPPLQPTTASRSFGRAPQHNPRETAQYVADMVLELRNIAKAESFGTLQGLLEIAYYEAFSVAHKVDVPEGELEHLESLGNDAMKA